MSPNDPHPATPAQTEDDIGLGDSTFTVILRIRVDDSTAGHILQWDTFFFKFAIYQTEHEQLQIIWSDKG